MKRYIIALLLALLLAGCGMQDLSTKASIQTPRPTTSQGTPISDESEIPRVKLHDTPDSTCFSAVGFDSGTGTLIVVFRDSGAKYAYDDVPKSVYDELCRADSMGGYYNKNIKGNYDCTKIE